MEPITFYEMLHIAVDEILNPYLGRTTTFYWRNGDGEYHKIVELDLLSGRFYTDDRDFSEFAWEMKESNIFIEES